MGQFTSLEGRIDAGARRVLARPPQNMPILGSFLPVSIFIRIAENIGTWSRAWVYPSQQEGWTMVSVVNRQRRFEAAIDTTPLAGNVPLANVTR